MALGRGVRAPHGRLQRLPPALRKAAGSLVLLPHLRVFLPGPPPPPTHRGPTEVPRRDRSGEDDPVPGRGIEEAGEGDRGGLQEAGSAEVAPNLLALLHTGEGAGAKAPRRRAGEVRVTGGPNLEFARR